MKGSPASRKRWYPSWRQNTSSPALLDKPFGRFYPVRRKLPFALLKTALLSRSSEKQHLSYHKACFFLLNLFPSVIYKANHITPITEEFLMRPDEGSSYLRWFVTQFPTHIFSSPIWLLCSYCCQQVCFLFSSLMNISIQNTFCIFIGLPQTCGLSSIDVESTCRSRQSVDCNTFPCHTFRASPLFLRVASHCRSLWRGEQHPLPRVWMGLCPVWHAVAPAAPRSPLQPLLLQRASLCFPFKDTSHLCGDCYCLLPNNPECVWPHWHPQWGRCTLRTSCHLEMAPAPTKINTDSVKLWGQCPPPATLLLVLPIRLVSV